MLSSIAVAIVIAITAWLYSYTTRENPFMLKVPPPLDVDLCVKLHNEIVSRGLAASNRSIADIEVQNWFQFNGKEAEAARHFLSADTTAFLERVHANYNESFHYYVGTLTSPSRILQFNTGYWSEEPSKKKKNLLVKYVILYEANNIASHPEGLILDQETNTAMICMSIFDAPYIGKDLLQWHRLEVVLQAWLDMVDAGKVRAVSEAENMSVNRYDPWVVVPYTATMLEETIEAFSALVNAIESRMPSLESFADAPAIGLVDVDVLNALDIPVSWGNYNSSPHGFAYDFIRQVQRPRFKFIAPGLEIPNESTFLKQAFFGVDEKEAESDIPPICLFSSSHQAPPPGVPASRLLDVPFPWPYHRVANYPAGLYFSDVAQHSGIRFDDQCVLILPFGIGANGYARTSDGALFGARLTSDVQEARNTYADLYQAGHQPFTEVHYVRLVTVLRIWLGMVERGDWKIDNGGVAGGIEEWRKADTRGHWEKYVSPVGW